MKDMNPYWYDKWFEWGVEHARAGCYTAPWHIDSTTKGWQDGIDSVKNPTRVLEKLTDEEAAAYIQEVARDAETIDLTEITGDHNAGFYSDKKVPEREQYADNEPQMAQKLPSGNVGDATSTARGSGARFTAGKAKAEYIPMRVMLDSFFGGSEADKVLPVLMLEVAGYIAAFEEGNDTAAAQALDLVFKNGFLKDTCAQFDFGAKKYAAWNWAKGMAWSVPLACLKRHWLKLAAGEEIDEDSGVSHWGAIGCNLVMLVHFVRHYRDGDDRPPRTIFGGD